MNDIEKLENFKTITILYGNTFVMHTEQLKEIQESIGNVLADLYEANNRINDLLDIVKQKDKLIDLMAQELIDQQVRAFKDNFDPFKYINKDQVKKYFEEMCSK